MANMYMSRHSTSVMKNLLRYSLLQRPTGAFAQFLHAKVGAGSAIATAAPTSLLRQASKTTIKNSHIVCSISISSLMANTTV